MIQVYPVSKKLKKYCSHCDSIAVFEIWFCNEKIIQQSAAGCLCEPCMALLKAEVAKAIAPNTRTPKTRKSAHRAQVRLQAVIADLSYVDQCIAELGYIVQKSKCHEMVARSVARLSAMQ